jgi:hypothetical protein
MGRLQKAKFLEGLSDRISAPVMPDDEPLECLPTQAVADFLATEVNPPLDRIIYRSVQTGDDKLNIALFHNSSRVQTLDIPKGTTFNTTLYREDDDGALEILNATYWRRFLHLHRPSQHPIRTI